MKKNFMILDKEVRLSIKFLSVFLYKDAHYKLKKKTQFLREICSNLREFQIPKNVSVSCNELLSYLHIMYRAVKAYFITCGYIIEMCYLYLLFSVPQISHILNVKT